MDFFLQPFIPEKTSRPSCRNAPGFVVSCLDGMGVGRRVVVAVVVVVVVVVVVSEGACVDGGVENGGAVDVVLLWLSRALCDDGEGVRDCG